MDHLRVLHQVSTSRRPSELRSRLKDSRQVKEIGWASARDCERDFKLTPKMGLTDRFLYTYKYRAEDRLVSGRQFDRPAHIFVIGIG